MSDKKLYINVRKKRGDFALSVEQSFDLSGITAIFGPSGSGKTSLLRLITGLDKIDSGEVRFKEQLWASKTQHIPPHKRSCAYMFQSGALFPHLTAEQNLDYAAKRATQNSGPSKDDIIDNFGIGSLLSRRINSLSGGEARRIALARTLLSNPEILLLDEPFAGLDHPRIRGILPYLETLPARYNIPILYVSHDISTVARLADNILVLNGGEVTEFGAAADIINKIGCEPGNSKTTNGIFLSGKIDNIDPNFHLTHIAIGEDRLTYPELTARKFGTDIRVQILARDVSIALKAPKDISVRNILPARITALRAQEETAYMSVTLKLTDGQMLYAQITRASAAELKLSTGQNVFAMVKALSFGEQWL
ncbi:MAG: molybdenum ABC transporter ATP-binding protein [Maricaulaceae bacterium]